MKEYKTFVTEKKHKELMRCASVLAKAEIIKKPTRYALTQYALKNLVNSFKIVEARKQIIKEIESALDKAVKKKIKAK